MRRERTFESRKSAPHVKINSFFFTNDDFWCGFFQVFCFHVKMHRFCIESLSKVSLRILAGFFMVFFHSCFASISKCSPKYVDFVKNETRNWVLGQMDSQNHLGFFYKKKANKRGGYLLMQFLHWILLFAIWAKSLDFCSLALQFNYNCANIKKVCKVWQRYLLQN